MLINTVQQKVSFWKQIPRVLESNTGSVSVQILFFYLVTLFYFFILSPSSVFLTCHPLLFFYLVTLFCFFYLVTLFCFFILSPSSVFARAPYPKPNVIHR